MSAIVNRRKFLESAHAYAKAGQPTADQVYQLCASLAQMLSDDLGAKVKVVLPGDNRGKKIARNPKGEPCTA